MVATCSLSSNWFRLGFCGAAGAAVGAVFSHVFLRVVTHNLVDAAPIVDVSQLLNEHSSLAERQAVGDSLLAAAKHHGIVRAVGHNVDGAAVLAAARRYFDLPLAARKSSRNASSGWQRGYIPLAGESGLAENLEVKEGFCYGYNWPKDEPPKDGNALEGLNVWPSPGKVSDEVLGPEWRSIMETYYEDAVRVAKASVAGIALAIGEENSSSSRRTPLEELSEGGEKISQMRLFHYFPETYAPELSPGKRRLGSSPHTDWHLITVILRDVYSRLQYKTRDSSGKAQPWTDVDGDDKGSELLLIFGDYLSMYADGQLHSPVHRVLLPEDNSSLSFVLFFYPRFDARMPVKKSLSQGVLDGSGAPREKHNTLLDQVHEVGLDLPFGEYLAAKWRKVLGNAAS
eukprot:TRINITY_DN49204_c0_g1_i1.p1 TRINITY_DN49204_c0_g1~~TRINITY_DN49204_c0_g1_i1.p1  ORF type:complete len:434 (-),score=66.07 TRINITY_DN49204_c0_g1_i1:67-1266(-)